MDVNRKALRRQAGLGIVEILVAVLVLSIGLLGLAGLQVRTLRNNQSSMERGVAVVETHAIADAMRADRQNAVNGLYNLGLTDADPTGMQFRNAVLRGWRQNLRTALGQEATGQVDCNGALCEIIVQWDDERATLGDDEQQLRTMVQL